MVTDYFFAQVLERVYEMHMLNQKENRKKFATICVEARINCVPKLMFGGTQLKK
jgi:hypothetical protein